MPDTFFPSLFQKHIKKSADIRIFYLLGECYSMAIMSQENIKTRVDFRHYDEENPNINIPYELDTITKQKINILMNQIGLETGSIDMILTNDGKLIFLEVNPVGQFNMVSVPCNYNLEKKFAAQLVKLAGYDITI